MAINTKLSVTGCWRMVNAIENGKDATEVRERCRIAASWLEANEVINYDQFNELMMTVAYIHRESYHWE